MAFVKRTSKTVPTDMTYNSSTGITEYNKYWYTSEYSTSSGSICLPNCTTYAMGRSGEIAGKSVKGYDMLNRSGFGNAANWFSEALWETGQTPKVGAIACWTDNGNGWGGHVAIVEETDGTNAGTYLSMSGYQAASSGTRSFTNPGSSASWFFKYLDFSTTNYYYTTYNNRGGTFQGYIYNPYVQEHETPKELSSSVQTSGNIKYIEWKNSYKDGDAYKYVVTVANNEVSWDASTNNRFNMFTTWPKSSPGNEYSLVAAINGNIWGNETNSQGVTVSYPIGFVKTGDGTTVYRIGVGESSYDVSDILAIGSTLASGGSTLKADLYQNMVDSLSNYKSALNGNLVEDGKGYIGPNVSGAYSSAIHSFIGYNDDIDTAFMGYCTSAMTGATLISQVKNIFGSNSKVCVLDGGGSTQMYLNGEIVRQSSDSGGVRKVENCICIYKKALASLPQTVQRDALKNQIQIGSDITKLNCRTLPSTSGVRLGYVEAGGWYDVYDIYQEEE